MRISRVIVTSAIALVSAGVLAGCSGGGSMSQSVVPTGGAQSHGHLHRTKRGVSNIARWSDRHHLEFAFNHGFCDSSSVAARECLNWNRRQGTRLLGHKRWPRYAVPTVERRTNFFISGCWQSGLCGVQQSGKTDSLRVRVGDGRLVRISSARRKVNCVVGTNLVARQRQRRVADPHRQRRTARCDLERLE